MLKRLVEREDYVPALFLRDPVERVRSMYTGTVDAGGPDPSTTTFHQFVAQLEMGMYALNQHMAPQMKLCNFGRSRNESSIPWKLSSSTPRWPVDSRETTSRAQRFVGELFGNAVLSSIRGNWTQCPLKGFSKDDFFSAGADPVTEKPPLTRALRRRINAVYAEDREAYLEAEQLHSGSGGGEAQAEGGEAKGEGGSERGLLPAIEAISRTEEREPIIASPCSTCGANEKGVSNCCNVGGSWAETCSISRSDGREHTWLEGWEACNGARPVSKGARPLSASKLRALVP
jgi:hypothetical protein